MEKFIALTIAASFLAFAGTYAITQSYTRNKSGKKGPQRGANWGR
jgi:hypothetical protein